MKMQELKCITRPPASTHPKSIVLHGKVLCRAADSGIRAKSTPAARGSADLKVSLSQGLVVQCRNRNFWTTTCTAFQTEEKRRQPSPTRKTGLWTGLFTGLFDQQRFLVLPPCEGEVNEIRNYGKNALPEQQKHLVPRHSEFSKKPTPIRPMQSQDTPPSNVSASRKEEVMDFWPARRANEVGP